MSDSHQNPPVASWVDKIEAAVDPVVFNVPPVQARLISEVLVVFLIDELNDWSPAARACRNGVYEKRGTGERKRVRRGREVGEGERKRIRRRGRGTCVTCVCNLTSPLLCQLCS